jgi:phosphohistidine phosphatase
MRTLYLIRHAKSSWKYPNLEDRHRPLKKRGETDAHIMGAILNGKGIKPGLIMTSPAKRAYDTACIFAEDIGYPVNQIVQNDNLYFSGMPQILEVIQQTDNQFDDVFVFGHNPDTLDLLNTFAPTDYENIPTSGVACIQFEVDSWSKITLKNGIFRWLDFPSAHR